MTVLFVSNEELFNFVASKIFTKKNIKSVVLSSGKKSIELYEKNPKQYTTIVTDVDLDDMASDYLIKRVREKNKLIPIYVMLFFEDIYTIKKYEKLGTTKILMKPFSFLELINNILVAD